MPKYKRVIVKVSGESLSGKDGKGINPKFVREVANELKEVYESGIELAIVVGGGNLWRGGNAVELGMDRASADYMGMMGTIMNGLAIQNMLEALNVPSRVMSAISVNQVCEPYIKRKAVRHFEKGRVVIFAGGTGNPFFTTDSAAALRAADVDAEAILMAKNGVDGIYDMDPNIHSNAVKFDELTFMDVITKELKVMDITAITICRENNVELIVFNGNEKGNILKVLDGQKLGTIIKEG